LRGVNAKTVQRARFATEIEIFGRREVPYGIGADAGYGRFNPNETSDIRIRQWTEHDLVEHREDPHRGRHPQRQRSDADDGERRAAPERARGMFHVGCHVLEPREPALIA
jgi:hypothetical protein